MGSSKIGAEKLLAVLDRPIAFQRVFVAVAGSVAGAVMLSQMVYWQRRAGAEGGWWYKSREDWTDEVGLSRREQETARAALRAHGILEEQTRGIPRRLYYRLNVERLAELVGAMADEAAELQQVTSDQQAGTEPPSKQVTSGQQGGRKRTSKQGGNVPTNTETTSETTREREEAAPRESRSPDVRTLDEPNRPEMPPSGRPPSDPRAVKPMRVTQEELDQARNDVCRALSLPLKAWFRPHEYDWTRLWRACAGDTEELAKIFVLGRKKREAAGHVGVTVDYVLRTYEALRTELHQPTPVLAAKSDDARFGAPSAAKARGWCQRHPSVGLGPEGCSRCLAEAAA